MKKLFLFLVFLSAGLILSYFLYFSNGGNAKRKVFIKEGTSTIEVARLLKNKGIIHSALVFRFLAKITGNETKIMPGKHIFRTNLPAFKVLKILISTPYIDDVKILIPEGWRAEQIAERLEKNQITDGKAFLKIVKDEKLEGYLFPSTFFFKKNTPPEKVVKKLVSEFDKNIRPLFKTKFPGGLNEKKALIIASIVEREAVIDSERPLISAVYLNRMKKKMALEADPTVQYALGYWKKNLTYRDLRTKSLYNTYVVRNLPPGPICSPGYESVYAVMHPAEIDALYFVADRTGKHIFNVSFKEHKKAIKRIKKSGK